MSAEERARRFRQAVEAYRDRGGSIRGLATASGVAGANIYRALKDGEGLGRETVAKLAPELGVSPEFLLGLTAVPGSAPAPETAMIAWIRSLPREIWPDLKKYGDALATAHRARTAGSSQVAGKLRRRRGSSDKGTRN